MKQSTRSKVITRAIHFIATNTNNDSKRIGSAIIEELKLIEESKSTDVQDELKSILEQMEGVYPEHHYDIVKEALEEIENPKEV